MGSLFDAAENEAIVARLAAVTADTRPRWGKLNATGMLAHCDKPLLVARGELQLRRGLVGVLFGGWAKRKFIDRDGPFQKGGPTDPHFLAPGADDFAAEQARLIEHVRDFARRGPDGLTREPHPFFGRLTAEQWDRLMWKHLDHHLRQFGV